MADRATQGTSKCNDTSFIENDIKLDYGQTGSDVHEFDGDTNNDFHQDDTYFQPNQFFSDNSVSESHGALNFAPPDFGSRIQNNNLQSLQNEVPAADVIDAAADIYNGDVGVGRQTKDAGSRALAFNFEVVKDNPIKPIVTFSDNGSRPSVVGEAGDALKAADQLRAAGKTTEAQAKYEEALKKVKEVDMATVTTQWQSQMKEYNVTGEKLNALGNPPSNPQEAQKLAAELQQHQDTGLQLEQTIQGGKEVKVQYATFLNEQGKPNEALLLLASAAAQTPTDLLVGDKNFKEQMERAQSTGLITSGDAEIHSVLLERALSGKDYPTALRELASLKEASNKASESYLQSAKDKIAVMSKRQTEIDTELAELQQNTKMSQEAKELRQQQLNNEKKAFDVLRKAVGDSFGPAEKAAEEHNRQMRYIEEHIKKKQVEEEAKKAERAKAAH